MAVDLTPLVTLIIDRIPPVSFVLLSVFSAILSVLVISFACSQVFSAIRGKKFIAGKYWDYDVYESAMRDLYAQKRNGVLLDKESNDALKEYRFGSRRSRRF